MDPKLWKERQASENAVHPYTWVAVYNDGTHLKQFEMNKAHNSLDIDKKKLKALVVMNHPMSPIQIVPPYSSAPTEVVIKATVALSYKIGMVDMKRHSEKASAKYKFGFKYRRPQIFGGASGKLVEEIYLLVIDAGTGEVYKTNRDE